MRRSLPVRSAICHDGCLSKLNAVDDVGTLYACVVQHRSEIPGRFCRHFQFMQAQLRSCQFQTTPIKLYIALFIKGRLNTLLDKNLEIVRNRNTKRFVCTVYSYET